jgi:hypothetical protein
MRDKASVHRIGLSIARAMLFIFLGICSTPTFAQWKNPHKVKSRLRFQKIKPDLLQLDTLALKPGISFRGLSVVSDLVFWVSGSKGTIGRTIDGGDTWKWYQVEGFEQTDFRDIHAFDAQSALIMGIGSPGYILHTFNGGESWRTVYQNDHPDVFLDAMHFWNSKSGIVIGDPIDNKVLVLRTFDGGQNWLTIKKEDAPPMDKGEAFFAASGTNVQALSAGEAVFVSGGASSNVFIRDKKIPLPLLQGNSSSGANSIAVRDARKRHKSKVFAVVGGDFSKDTLRKGNMVLTFNKGKTWEQPQTPPFGYRSCIIYLWKKVLVTCGTNGVDLSLDGGKNFRPITSTGFHVCASTPRSKWVLLAGNGRIGRIKVP